MNTFFLNMIKTLRKNQEVILYDNILEISENEKQAVVHFLNQEYEREKLTFPFTPPDFNSITALWAAEYVYIAAQLMLYRQNQSDELQNLLPVLDFDETPSAILSIDLCFRFIPDILVKLKLIDFEDPLIHILEKNLHQWHYSGVNYVLNLEKENFDVIFDNDCLKQLYANRIVAFKNEKLMKFDIFKDLLGANFGNYKDRFIGNRENNLN